MGTIIGKVQGLEGKFFAKDASGDIIELKNGDEITQGMIVFGDKGNSSTAYLNIVVADTNEMIIVAGNSQQLFDTSLTEDDIMDGALAEESIEDAVNNNILASKDEEDLAILDETAAGAEEQSGQTKDGEEANFKSRDADATDINSDLRKAEFKGAKLVREEEGEDIIPEPDLLQTPPSTPPEVTDNVKVVLVAVDSATTTIADITDSDGKLILDSANETPEGGKLHYMAVAVDEDGKPVSQNGEVTVAYGKTADTTDDDAETTDYVANTTSVAIGTVFSADATDDYMNENDETLSVTISDPVNTSYDTVAVDTDNDEVVSTITDNEPKDPTPDEGEYGSEDTVYVKITGDDTQAEGSDLTHTVTLVDADGKPVTVEDGETITVTLGYTPDATDGATVADYTAQTTVTITGGNSSATVTNPALTDSVWNENDESYTVAITDVAQANDSYENVAITTVEADQSATGTITDDYEAPKATNDTNIATETGSEFILSEDSIDTDADGHDDGQSATGNILNNDTGTSSLSVSSVSLGSTRHDLPNDGSDLTVTGSYGTLTINNAGVYTYDVNESITDSWNTDKIENELFTYNVTDGYSEVSADLKITVEGRDDAPVIESITANNKPIHKVDGIMDLDGDGNMDVIDPDALTAQDKGIIFNAENGDLNINMGTGGSSMSVEYNGGQAGYHNALGYYTADENGNPTQAHIIYVEDASMVGSKSELLGTLNNLEGNVGFFIIPNGGNNGVGMNSSITFDNNGNMLVDGSIKEAFYTDNDLNKDGNDHVVAGPSENGNGLVIGFEDLKLGDRDYDDVVITINPCETLTENNKILKDINLSDVDDANLESATVKLTNFKDGDVISADNLPSGITATITDGLVTLNGTATIADYEAALESLTFETTSTDRGVREFEFTVFDGDKHSNTMEVKVDIGGCELNTYTPDPGVDATDDTVEVCDTQTPSNLPDISNVIVAMSDGTFVKIDGYSGTNDYQDPKQYFADIESKVSGDATITDWIIKASSDNSAHGSSYWSKDGEAITLPGDVSWLSDGDLKNNGGVKVDNEFSKSNLLSDGVDYSNDAGVTVDTATNSVTISSAKLLSNDADLDGTNGDLYISAITQTDAEKLEGMAVLNNNGSVTFTRTADFDGEATFTYTLKDADGNTDTAKVTIDGTKCIITNTTTAIDDYGHKDTAQGEFDVTEAVGTDGGQSVSDVASLKDGGYVIAWSEVSGSSYRGSKNNDLNNDGDLNDSGEVEWATRENNDVFIQRYDVDGDPVGEATRVNSFVTNTNEEGGRNQHDVNVVGLDNGNYLVTWSSDDHFINHDNWDNGSVYIQGQIFDVNGEAVCGEFNVSRAEYDPIVALPDGGFIVTWSADARLDNTDQGAIDNPIYSDTHDDSGFAVVAQRFDALGNEVGDRLIVNQTTTNDQVDSDIVMLDDSTAIMTWQSEESANGNYDVYAQRLELTDNGLVLVGDEIAVNTTAGSDQTDPEVTALSDGSAVITYESGSSILAQTISANGSVGTEMTISSSGENPVITPLSAGFVVVYEDGGAIYAKTYDGTSLSDATQISESGLNQTQPAVTTLEDGGYVISWQNDDGISAHRFNANGSDYVQNEFDMMEDTSITITVDRLLENDYDEQGHDFKLTSVENPVNGTVVANDTDNDGVYDSVTFTPNADYNGPATFDYTITDELGATDPATVHLDVKPQGEPTIFVGTMCDADIQSHDIVVNEGEEAVLAVKISGAEENSTVSLTLADGSALATEDYDTTFSYSFDGTNWTEYDSSSPIEIPEGASKFAVKMDTVENSVDELDENFTLSATLSSGESDTGTVTIIDDDLPEADAPVLELEVNEVRVLSQTIDATNVLSENGGYTVTAYNEDGTQSTVSQISGTNHDGFGVNGSVESGQNHTNADKELGYDTQEGASESIIVEFDYDLSSVDVGFSWKHSIDNVSNTDYIGEMAVVEFFKDGQSLGTQEDLGGTDKVDAPVTFSLADGSSFDTIKIYGKGEGDDFLVNQISYERVLSSDEVVSSDADIAYSYTLDVEASLTDTDGSETLSDVTVNNLPAGVTLAGGAGVIDHQDGNYSIDLDANGVASVDIVSSGDALDVNEISAIKGSVTATETDGGDTATTEATANKGDSIEFNEVDDTLVVYGDLDLDFSDDNMKELSGISKIDLTDGSHDVELSLDKVLEMTDSDNELEITGDTDDKLDVDTTGWTETGDTTDDVYTYNNDTSDSSITLTVDDQIDTTGI